MSKYGPPNWILYDDGYPNAEYKPKRTNQMPINDPNATHRERPGKGFVYCIISPVARIHGIYYQHPRKWWKTRKEAETQAKEILKRDTDAVLVVVKATHQLEAEPNVRSTNIR